MKDLILDLEQNYKPIKIPNKLQCFECGEVIHVYHTSILS